MFILDFFSNNLSFYVIELKNEEQHKLNINRRKGIIYVRTKEMKLKTKAIGNFNKQNLVL